MKNMMRKTDQTFRGSYFCISPFLDVLRSGALLSSVVNSHLQEPCSVPVDDDVDDHANQNEDHLNLTWRRV